MAIHIIPLFNPEGVTIGRGSDSEGVVIETVVFLDSIIDTFTLFASGRHVFVMIFIKDSRQCLSSVLFSFD